MIQIIKCPNCDTRSWSSDYWTCPNCGYSESREWVLLEENKDYLDGGKTRGDEPSILLNTWMEEQKDLTREMVNECLPRSKYSWELDCNKDLGVGKWGATIYYENDPHEVRKFKIRHMKDLIEKGKMGIHWDLKVLPNGRQIKIPLYPYYSHEDGFPPTKIYISNWVLQREGEYRFDGWGYFPTIPHETAHADPAVIRHPQFKPLSSQYSLGTGHDDIHNNKNREFYDKLVSKKYIEKIKGRFKELRKIQGKDENKYDN